MNEKGKLESEIITFLNEKILEFSKKNNLNIEQIKIEMIKEVGFYDLVGDVDITLENQNIYQTCPQCGYGVTWGS